LSLDKLKIDEVKYLGYLNNKISSRLAYSSVDAIVAPSLYEAFGKALAEVMACVDSSCSL